jgi:hypothetical protein
VNLDEDLIRGEPVPETFVITIWPRPEIQDWEIHRGKLPDGMVGPCSSACTNTSHIKPPDPLAATPPITWLTPQSEPDEIYFPSMGTAKPYDGVRIESSLPDGLEVTQIAWSSWDGTKPSQGVVAFPANAEVISNSDLIYTTDPSLVLPSFTGENLYITGKTTDETVANDYRLNIGFSISHPNPNINNALTGETFDLRIWRRAYLSVVMQHPDMPWSMTGDVSRLGTLEIRQYARAVIPGQWGTIRAARAGDFIRWEVKEPSSIPREVLPGSGATSTLWPGISECRYLYHRQSTR